MAQTTAIGADPSERGGRPELGTAEVRRRAVVGAATLGFRGVAVQLVGLAGNVLLARLLVPADFGHAAFGLALLAPLSVLVSTGLGGAFIQSAERPEREDLETLAALQLAAAVVLAAVAVAVLWPLGETGRITAVMVASLPIMILRTPGAVLLERDLSYRLLVGVELAESAAFYGVAVTGALLGWGAWAIAAGAVGRAVAGSALMLALGPAGLLRPRFSITRARGFIGYGTRLQGFFLVVLGRDQALNAEVAALGGIGILGLWTVANRILQVPALVFASLNRVAFPAMARLLALGHDPRPLVERAIAVAAVGTGAILVPLAGSAPALVPAVLGGRWTDARLIVPWACLGLMVGGPVTVAVAAFLWATKDTTPLQAVTAQSVTWLALAAGLLPVIGISAIGVAWMCASFVDATVLGRRASRRTGARIFRPLAIPLALAIVGGGVGWLTADVRPTIAWAAAGACVAEGVYLAGLLLVQRAQLRELLGLSRHAVATSVAGAHA